MPPDCVSASSGTTLVLETGGVLRLVVADPTGNPVSAGGSGSRHMLPAMVGEDRPTAAPERSVSVAGPIEIGRQVEILPRNAPPASYRRSAFGIQLLDQTGEHSFVLAQTNRRMKSSLPAKSIEG
jgi:hypothetical protein